MSENAEELSLLLRWIYPSNDRLVFATVYDIGKLLPVAKKYEVTLNLLQNQLCCHLSVYSQANVSPLVYALAIAAILVVDSADVIMVLK